MGSAALVVPVSGLRRGPIARDWHIDTPAERLGEIPEGIRDLDLAVELSEEGGGGVRARGRLSARARVACRRCLADVDLDFEAPLDAWFRPPGDVEPGEAGVWELDPGSDGVDLSDPVREELWLAMPDYVVCEEACEGLCGGCGVRLGEEECRCPPPEPDPRWGALEELRDGEGGTPGAGARRSGEGA